MSYDQKLSVPDGILISAVRHALHRNQHIAEETVTAVLDNLALIHDGPLHVIGRDIAHELDMVTRHERRWPSRPTWQRSADAIRAEQDRRTTP